MNAGKAPVKQTSVLISAGEVMLEGELSMPPSPIGVVLFAHGSPAPGYRFTAHLTG